MKKSAVFLSHVLLWGVLYAIVYILFTIVISIIRPPFGVLPSGVVYPLTFYTLLGLACPFYIYYALFSRLQGHESKLFWNSFSIVVLILLPIVLLQLADEVISVSNYLTSFAFILFFALLGCSFRSFFLWLKENNLREKFEKQQLKSELDLLRLQINPHFLFNTLHNIDTLISKDPATASKLLIKLSELLRYMLYESDVNKVSLSREIEFIESFVLLQSQRLKNKDLVGCHIKGDPVSLEIPPMLLIPFVENAFKHYAPNTEGDGINIKIEISNELMNFSCSNSYSLNDVNKDKSSGIGLNTVKRRLELIFHDKYALLINKDNNIFNVNLTIPVNEN